MIEIIWNTSKSEASFSFSSIFLMGITQELQKDHWDWMENGTLMYEIFRTDLTLVNKIWKPIPDAF